MELRPAEQTRPYLVLGLVTLLLAFGLFGGWSALAPLDEAVVVSGRVTVESNRKTVQHLEGGIISEILVQEGDPVKRGAALLRMSETQQLAQLEIVRLQYLDALLLEARLQAELAGSRAVDVGGEVAALMAVEPRMEQMAAIQSQIFLSRQETLEREISILNRRRGQIQAQIEGLRQLGASRQQQIDAYAEEIEEWQQLYQRQLTDKQRLRELRHQKIGLEGGLAELQAEIAQLQIKQGETEEQILLRRGTRQSEVEQELRDTRRTIADLKARMTALEDTLSRTVVRAPDDGVVVGLKLHTVGGVVEPGEPMMYIVPDSRSFIVEVQIPAVDIDKVFAGLAADIRFSAFKFFQGMIDGEVGRVSADSFVDERSGASYYDATVKVLPGGATEMHQEGVELISGMPAEVVIKTGKRTLLDYILKPFTNLFIRAFREE